MVKFFDRKKNKDKNQHLPKINTELLFNLLEDSYNQCEAEFEEVSNKWFRQTSINDMDQS